MHGVPRRPIGRTNKVDFDRRVHDEVFSRLRIVQTPSVKVDRTMRGLRVKVAAPRRTAREIRYHPFKVYKSPVANSTAGEAAWRTFRVRGGVVIGSRIAPVVATLTDGVDDPWSKVVPPFNEDIEIEVASDVAEYFIWLEVHEELATAIVNHSATPPDEWSLTVIPLAVVDTDTHAASHFAEVRQYRVDDYVCPCLTFPEE